MVASDIPSRAWYHIATPFEINPNWPEAHLYEVTDGGPPTAMSEEERDEVIRSIRRDCAGRQWHPSLLLGYKGAIVVEIGDTTLRCCLLLVEHVDELYHERSGRPQN